MGSKKRASFTVRAGSVELPVYHRRVLKSGGRYDEWTLAFYDSAGKRCRSSFSDQDKAKKEAERIALAMSRGQSEAIGLTAADCDIYKRALLLVKPSGLSLLSALSEWSEARAKLPAGATLTEAAVDHAKRHPSGVPKRTVADVVAELVADGQARKLSAEHLSDMNKRLTRFAQDFQCQISSVTPAQLLVWLRGLKAQDGRALSNRTKFNFQRLIVGLFRFASRMRYIPRALADEMADLDRPKPEAASAEVFTPKEIATILPHVPENLIPSFVLGAFAGLRPAEIARLEWSDIRMDQQVLIVGAHQAKTASRRVVPLAENLVEWLKPRLGQGRVCPVETPGWMAQKFADAAKVAGLPWRRNGLRHSYISYRLALIADPARVATESGNSAAMVHKHYKALVLESEATQWFGIRPTQPAKGPSPSARN